MGRPSNTEERRAQIVGGLLEVMAERGYEGATIVAIAKAAGLRSGLVHYHFETKRAILVALVERLVETVEQRFRSRLQGVDGTPRERLDAWIDAHLALGPDADPDAVAAWIFIGGEAIRQADVREIYQRAMRSRISGAQQLVRDVLMSDGRSTQKVAELAALLV
ncbi:MAG: TetR family transcriptional regulator, partial [Polyangiaceae bacterium]